MATTNFPGSNVYRALAPLRAMSYLNRQTPTARPPRPEQQAFYDANNMPVDPAALQDPNFRQHANALLQPYGLSVPSSMPQNVFLPSTGFFGRHPGLASGIENAFFAAANTPVSETGGDVIPNILRGALGGRAERAQMLTAGFQAPFRIAGQLEGLRDAQQKHDLQEAEIQHYRAMAQHYGAMDQNNADKINAVAPRPADGGAWVFDPDAGKWNFQEGPGGKAARYAATGGLAGEIVHAIAGPMPSDPKQQAAWAKKARAAYNSVMGGVAGARAGATDYVHLHDDTAQTQTDKQQQAAGKAKAAFIAQKSKDYAFLAMNGIDPQSKDVGAKVGAWYDANVAPALDNPMGGGADNSGGAGIQVIRDPKTQRIIGIR